MRSILIPMVDDDGNTPAARVNRAKALVLTPFQTLPDGDMQSRESIAVGVNNWIRWERPGGLDVRVSLDVTGPRILIDGVTVFPGHARQHGSATVRASDLRDLPLGQLENALNERILSATIRHLMDESQEDPLELDFSPGNRDVQFAFTATKDRPDPTPSLVLSEISEPPRPDAFYIEVADIWARALGVGHKHPAQVIASANGTDAPIVHRWVREARRRGLMAPSSRSTNAQSRGATATRGATASSRSKHGSADI